MNRPEATTVPTAETPVLSEQERRARLERLAERLLQPDGLDHETLERLEQLNDDEH